MSLINLLSGYIESLYIYIYMYTCIMCVCVCVWCVYMFIAIYTRKVTTNR